MSRVVTSFCTRRLLALLVLVPCSIAQNAETDEAKRMATAYAEEARTHVKAGLFTEAVADWESAVDVLVHEPEIARYVSASLCNEAGEFFRARAHPASARRCYEHIQSLGETADQYWQLGVSVLCEMDIQEGHYASARYRLSELYAALDSGHALKQKVLRDMAAAHLFLGDLAQCHEILDELEGQTDRETAPELYRMILELRSHAFEAEEDWESAHRLADQALDLYTAKDRVNREHIGLLIQRGQLGRLLGSLEQAETDYRLAKELAERESLIDLVMVCHDSLANLCLARGDLEGARELLAPALTYQREHLLRDHLLDTLTTKAHIEVSASSSARAHAAFDEGSELLRSVEVEGLGPQGSALLRSRFVRWGELAQDLIALDLSLTDSDEKRATVTLRGLVELGNWKRRAMFSGLAAAPPDRAYEQEELLAQAIAALGEDGLLIEYASGQDRLYAYVLHEERLELLDLGDRAEIEDLAAEVVRDVFVSHETSDSHQLGKRAHGLYQRLLDPIEERLGTLPTTLVIVPTAELALLPFEVLCSAPPDAKDPALEFFDLEYLIKTKNVSYGPSTPLLVLLHARGPRARPGRALLLGDPLAPAEDEASTARFGAWGNLARTPGAREELNGIANIFSEAQAEGEEIESMELLQIFSPRKRSGVARTEGFDIFVGSHANLDVLARDLSEFEHLHFAAHGVADTRAPSATGLVLSEDGQGERLLSVDRIRQLQLDASLVTIAGCRTKAGQVVRGEGIQSMAAGFLESGARSVVASLWTVDGPVTSALMQEFYVQMLLHLAPPPEALRLAKLAIMEQTAARGTGTEHSAASLDRVTDHPYYWSAFVYVGKIAR